MKQKPLHSISHMMRVLKILINEDVITSRTYERLLALLKHGNL